VGAAQPMATGHRHGWPCDSLRCSAPFFPCAIEPLAVQWRRLVLWVRPLPRRFDGQEHG